MRRLRYLLVAIVALAALPALGLGSSLGLGRIPETSISPGQLLQFRLLDLINADNANMTSGSPWVLTTPPGQTPVLASATVTNRMSILYATDPSVRDVLGGSAQMQGLPWLFRQEPSNSGPGAQLGAGNSQRMTKINGAGLAKMGSTQMLQALKGGVDRSCVTPAGIDTCPAHLVAVDEIGAEFAANPSPVFDADVSLSVVLRKLARLDSPWGGSYASRIHFYLAPGVSTAIAAGRGERHTLGADGQVHWPDYSLTIGALALAGGVWLEMYHYPTHGAARTPFTKTEWRTVPTAVAAFMAKRLAAYGISGADPLQTLHFVMTETAGNDLEAPGLCSVNPGDEGAKKVQEHSISQSGLPPCAPANVCISSGASSNRGSDERHSEMTVREPVSTGGTAAIDQGAALQIAPVDAGIEEFPVLQPSPSGMACQWQRAQTGAANLRILMNGPAAFRATGTEAKVFGALFRQFFIVA